MPVPPVSKWTTLIAKHKAPDTAGGVTVSKALAAYWNSGASTPKTYMAAYMALETALGKYIGKVDKKKVKDYEAFEKSFLNDFIGQVHKDRTDTERGMATLSTYKAEIVKFMTMVQKLDKKKSTRTDLEKFKQGPARGLSAMASRARGLKPEEIQVLNAITNEVKKVDTVVDTMPATPTQTQLTGYVTSILTIAEDIRVLAKNGGII
jgi:hypothetical protein